MISVAVVLCSDEGKDQTPRECSCGGTAREKPLGRSSSESCRCVANLQRCSEGQRRQWLAWDSASRHSTEACALAGCSLGVRWGALFGAPRAKGGRSQRLLGTLARKVLCVAPSMNARVPFGLDHHARVSVLLPVDTSQTALK
jgi:hypothetical protein